MEAMTGGKFLQKFRLYETRSVRISCKSRLRLFELRDPYGSGTKHLVFDFTRVVFLNFCL
jgi:hypothetical protein